MNSAPLAPTFAVLVPAFNGAAWLAECLGSVEGQLGPGDQLLVHDDGSTDGTPQLLRGWPRPLDVSRAENQGVSASRNLLARRARADHLLFLDADDLLDPQALAVLRAHLASHHAECVLTPIRFFRDEPGRPDDHLVFGEGDGVAGDSLGFFLRQMPPVSALVIQRAAFEAVGGFNPHLRHSEEFDLALRLCLEGARWTFQPRPVRLNRLYGGARASMNQRLCSWNAVAIMRRLLARSGGSLTAEHRRFMLEAMRGHGRILFRLGHDRPARAALRLADDLARPLGWPCDSPLDRAARFLTHYGAEIARRGTHAVLGRGRWGERL